MRRHRLRSSRLVGRLLKGLVAAYMGILNTTLASEPCIGVLYQEVREPYYTVLKEIITGIEQSAEWPIRRFPIRLVSQQEENKPLSTELACSAGVGLGRGGLLAVSIIDLPVVAGAVLMQLGETTLVPTISLVPDPAELFRRLKHFMPGAKKVSVIFNPAHTGQLIRMASRAAHVKGIELTALKAKDLRTALTLYHNLLETLNPESDALWLLQDPVTSNADTVLPLVLEQAWKRRLLIFSSQAIYVKNGVLFSVYPNNIRLGRRLGDLAQKCADQECPDTKIMLLRDLDTAVNTRMADHLDIQIDWRNDPYVDLIFPNR